MKKPIFTALMLLLVLATTLTLPVISPAEAAGPKEINLFFGSTTSISGTYIWAVSFARVVNKYVPGIKITVVESGATYDDLRRIREGVFHAGLATGYRGSYELYYGIDAFKKNAWKEIRFGLSRDLSVMRMYVRADSGLKTWADLAGKKIAGSIPGSLANMMTVRTVEVLGLGCTVVPGSLADGFDDVLAGKLAAVLKSSPPGSFDAGMMARHHKVPHTAIGFTDAQAAKLKAAFPHWGYTKTPANTIREIPGHPALWESYGPAGFITSSKLPQDIVYRITKGIYENWDEIGKAFPASKNVDPIKSYLNFVTLGAEVPLAAGVVQYAKEIGIEVRKEFIPPEYKSK